MTEPFTYNNTKPIINTFTPNNEIIEWCKQQHYFHDFSQYDQIMDLISVAVLLFLTAYFVHKQSERITTNTPLTEQHINKIIESLLLIGLVLIAGSLIWHITLL